MNRTEYINDQRVLKFDRDIATIRRSRRFLFSLSQMANVMLNGSHNLTIQEENYLSSYIMQSSCSIDANICKYTIETDNRPKLWFRALLALDQMGNVIFLNGSHKETMSSYLPRKILLERSNKAEIYLCAFLRKLENKHCIKSRGE